MSISSSHHDQETVLRMCRPCPYPEWLMLELPNGMFAAFWAEAIKIEHAISVAEGRYSEACAYRSRDRDKVLRYMGQNRLE